MRIKHYLKLFIFFIFLITACNKNEKTLLEKIESSESGLVFTNEIIENDTLNILESEFVYNGAGVALGDVNGDGLEDVFLAGNQVDNALFLNKGSLQFEDISELANIKKPNARFWSSGVNIIDINLDGKLDIYVCNTLNKNTSLLKNFLYINQGNNEQGIPSFLEMAERYGIADTTHSSHAQFFDYDNDGDLDLFIGVNLIEEKYPSSFIKRINDGSDPNSDKLFENNWEESLGHPVFTDVSIKAGLLQDGYSHSTLIHDFNEDGWMDIYVANDYQSDDLIFINNQDGTFSDRAGEIFKHFSLSAMGSDVADINNDGQSDFYTSEMQPYYNKRKKLFQGESTYQRELLTKKYKYHFQYTRNTLQLNRGISPETNLPIYSDIGMYAQVQETDWSWATLFADYDNDGWQDLYVVNGFPKDVTDRDFSDFRVMGAKLVSQEQLIAAIPEVKSPNFMFKNNGDLSFSDVSKDWGIDIGSFSNGAAYGDLDNDGDLDLIVNNIDDPVFLFESHAADGKEKNNYLRLKLKGSEKNPDAIGATVELYDGALIQKRFLLSGRGYLSKSENIVHFGLGKKTKADSIRIIWPGGVVQTIGETQANQVLEVAYNPDSAGTNISRLSPEIALFKKADTTYNLTYQDRDIDFIDFNFQRTLPHKFSQYGPSLAVGDVNKDGLDDVFIAASRGSKEQLFIQQADQIFLQKEITAKSNEKDYEEDAGSLLFDADNDGDLDLYIVRGGAQYTKGDSLYRDVLMINDGFGNFEKKESALPFIRANGSCVKAADYDQDGDLDLFIGSRVLPYWYPMPDRSFILKNESTPGNPKFVDVTESVNKDLMVPGLITDALWTDYNNDHWPDLIIVGEWMPITIFENQKGKLVNVTEQSGIENYHGWWNSLAAADFDNDGDTDYLGGNFGENLYFQCGMDTPLRVYGKDLDNNGSVDPLISCYWRDSIGEKHEYLYHPMQDVIKQFVGIRKKYKSFGQFGNDDVPKIFEGLGMEDAMILKSNWMKSSWIENLGNGKFEIHALPIEAQLAPIYGMMPYDLDGDEFIDILMVGNDFGMEVQQGRADAFNGLALKNNGKGEFVPQSIKESQFFVPGDGKSLVTLNVANEKLLVLASQNNDQLKVFEKNNKRFKQSLIRLKENEVKCEIEFLNGSKRVQEFYWGNTFQSQSSRVIVRQGEVAKITFFDHQGNETRSL